MEAAIALFSSPVFQIASTAFQVIGAISDANSRSDAYKNEAAWSQYNATISRQNADAALQQSAAQQGQQNRRTRQLMGEQRAAMAQSSTGFGGTNEDLIDQTATLAELDMLNIAYEGQMRARGHRLQAQGDDYRARMAKYGAGNARRAGYFNAGRSLLSGFGGYARGSQMGQAAAAGYPVGNNPDEW
jgi:hypothetical protein